MKGIALRGCAHMDSLDEMWEYLQKAHGNVSLVLSREMVRLREIGKCQGSAAQRRDFFIRLRDQLLRINNLASDHNLHRTLLSSSFLEQVYQMLPAYC